MNEIWADIKGFEGLYQVSNLGRVRTPYLRNGWGTFIKERIFVGFNNGSGYRCVHLWKDKKRHVRYVHRLVAEAFCEKRAGCNYINHLDHNRENNVWTNLEWCTQAENVRYSAELMRKPKENCKKSSTGEKYITLRKNRYRVRVHSNRKYYCDRSFNTLEEAIAYRDAVLKRRTA